MAEFIFKDIVKRNHLENDYYCESRAVSEDALGWDMNRYARDTLDKHNVPYGKHTSKLITKKDYDRFDIIFLMDERNRRHFFNRMDDPFGKARLLNSEDIEDPWYTGDFEKAYLDIEDGILRFLNL